MVGHSDMQVIDEDTCWEHLASVPLSRVGLVVDGRIDVLLVNHIVDGRTIVWRSGSGTKLGVAAAEAQVVVEADQIDAETHHGWSLLFHGTARIITDVDRQARLLLRDETPWSSPDRKPLWIEVVPNSVSGRQLG